MYNKEDIKRMNAQTDIRDFIPGLKGQGKHKYCTCPFCGKEGKGKGLVTYTPKGGSAESAAFCHSCEKGFSSATDAVQFYEKLKFPEAVRYVAEKTNFLIEEEKKVRATKRKEEKPKPIATPKRERTKSFCELQLEASGLTSEDVTAVVKNPDGSELRVPTFVKGGYDTTTWQYNLKDNEMLIFYYDLNGELVKYASRGAAGRQKDYVRVRWSNPDLHQNTKGKGVKYQTPPNAQSKIYFPQLIRTYYQNSTPLDTLIIQEGEKKAEKACKHGIPSIAIQGIQNIGNKETGIIQDLQYLVQRCQIKKVVLMFDSDWDHLSSHLSANDSVDMRPKSFAGAAKKFRNYVESMQNVNVSVDVYFGHIKQNEADEKGIDDLLCGTLKGKEILLGEDIKHAMLAHDGKADYVNIHKISTLSDYQIESFWNLREPEKFFERYRERLEPLGRFRINKITYSVEEGKIKVAMKYDSENELWNVKYDDNQKKQITFANREMLKFVAANGFYRMHTPDLPVDDYKFIHIEDGVIKESGLNEMRNFVYAYIEDNCKDEDVKEYFSNKVEVLMSGGKLSLLKMIDDNFDTYEPLTQRFYYRNGCLEVTADSISKTEQHATIWEDKIIKRHFERKQIIKAAGKKSDGSYFIELTEDGKKCEFLQFLQNTSNFWSNQEMTEEDAKTMVWHVINKLTAIGFLLNDYKFQSELKAVIAMDGQIGDIGQSNGRTGKSLIGVALKQMMEQTTIDGRNTKNDDDFLYSSVTPLTRNIFLDDVKVNFDFGRFYSAITTEMNVNPKGLARFTIPLEKSPKFYITTNHAINGTSDPSSIDRIVFMSFSDFYNENRKPVDDFGHSFFVDWDEYQWCLFDNLMVECNQLYLRSMQEEWHRRGQGAVMPPMCDIMLRALLQQMGSAFFQWAETFFDESAGHLNVRMKRKDMYDSYHNEFPDQKFGVTANNFRTKIELYCKMKHLDLNARKPNARGIQFFDFVAKNPEESFIGGMDKSNGNEYFTVSSREMSENGIL